MFRQRNLQLSMQFNANISGNFRPFEQISPETNLWVLLYKEVIQHKIIVNCEVLFHFLAFRRQRIKV